MSPPFNESPDTQQLDAIWQQLQTSSEVRPGAYIPPASGKPNHVAPGEMEVKRIADAQSHRPQQFQDIAESPVRDKQDLRLRRDEASNTAGLHGDARTRRSGCGRAPVPRRMRTKSSTPDPATKTRMRLQSKMFKTFDDVSDAGDTQPLDSQIYKQFISNLNSSRNTTRASQDLRDPAEEVDGLPTTQEGEDGLVDFMNEFRQMDQATQITVPSPQSQLATDARMTATFLMPKTPAAVGRQRNNLGDSIDSVARTSEPKTSTTRTPGSEMAAILGKTDGIPLMTLTQAFNQTQAPSSPLPDDAPSDLVFERPSPEFANFRPSSPASRTSSPLKRIHSEPLRATSAPLSVYITPKDRQNVCAGSTSGLTRTVSAIDGDEMNEFDEFENGIDRAARRRRICESMTDDALHDLGRLRPMSHDILSSRFKEHVGMLGPSTAPAAPGQQAVMQGSDDGSEAGSNTDEELSSLRKHGFAQEVSVQIPMTSSRNDRSLKLDQIPASTPSKIDCRQEIPASASQPPRPSPHVPKATQVTAIADSQKERSGSQKENDNPENDAHSQEQDILCAQQGQLLQSQYSSLSSNTRTVLETKVQKTLETSSIAPPPPHTSQLHRTGDASQMPSSPPVLASVAPERVDDQDEDEEFDDAGSSVNQSSDAGRNETETGPPWREHGGVIRDERNGAQTRLEPSDTSASTSQQNSRILRLDNDRVEPHAINTTDPSGNSCAYHAAQSSQTGSQSSSHNTQGSHADNISLGPLAENATLAGVNAKPAGSFQEANIDFENMNDDSEFPNLLFGSSPVGPSRKRQRFSRQKPQGNPLGPAHLHRNQVDRSKRVERDPYSFSQEMERQERQRQGADISLLVGFPKPALPRKQESKGKLARPTARLRDNRRTAGVSGSSRHNVASDPGGVHEILPNRPAQDGAELPDKTQRPGVSTNLPAADFEMPDIASNVVADSASRISPNRVFAMFKDGRHNNYYPASCIGFVKDKGFTIRFDDGTIATLEQQHFRRLELRIGDIVKVDLPKMRKDNFIVHGLQNPIASSVAANADVFPLTDERGFQEVILSVKQRDYRPSATAPPKESEHVIVPLAKVYLTHTLMWPRFHERVYNYGLAHGEPPASTPAPQMAASRPATPASRSRRPTASHMQGHARGVSSSSVRQESGLFSKMAFAVSFGDENSTDRRGTLRAIQENGATVLDHGFDTLFEVRDLETSSTSSSTVQDGEVNDIEDEPLSFTEEGKALGFVALITETHSRRLKYLQALALGLPCLHHRWVTDCVASKRVLPWSKYLLPSGESAWLAGAVRSRVLQPYDCLEARFADVVGMREKLLQGRGTGILLVEEAVGSTAGAKASRKASTQNKKHGLTKALDGRRKMFVFMTYAIGATRFRRVRDLESAKTILDSDQGEEWAWVYIDGDVGLAELGLFGRRLTNSLDGNRKRKRDDAVPPSRPAARLLSDEIVIQSVILGALAD